MSENNNNKSLEVVNITLTDEQIVNVLRGGVLNFIVNDFHIILKSEKSIKCVDASLLRDLFNNINQPHVVDVILNNILSG